MNEKSCQVLFTKWIRDNNYFETATFELKLCKGNNALPFSSFQPQQLPSLMQAKHGCVYKKLSDADPTLKPFDALQICHAKSYVIACWWHEGKGITAYWIDIDFFITEQKQSDRLSLTEQRAHLIAHTIIHL